MFKCCQIFLQIKSSSEDLKFFLSPSLSHIYSIYYIYYIYILYTHTHKMQFSMFINKEYSILVIEHRQSPTLGDSFSTMQSSDQEVPIPLYTVVWGMMGSVV